MSYPKTKIRSLPQGRLSELLEKSGNKKADLVRGRVIGGMRISLNKRTIAKVDKGEEVSSSSLEKIRQFLSLQMVEQL